MKIEEPEPKKEEPTPKVEQDNFEATKKIFLDQQSELD